MSSTRVETIATQAARLVETMKIMSLKVEVYYAAYAIEGVLVGLIQALVLGTVGYALGLFNGGAWFRIFGLIWTYCVATQMVSFLIASNAAASVLPRRASGTIAQASSTARRTRPWPRSPSSSRRTAARGAASPAP